MSRVSPPQSAREDEPRLQPPGRGKLIRRGNGLVSAGLGGLLLWLALPPADWWYLAWIAPIPWLHLIATTRPWTGQDYLGFAAVGFAFWMAALHWLRLPHWATSFGWVALSAYLAWYIPAFILLSRSAVFRLRLPLILAAPTIWAGLEVVRAHLLTGFTMASLGHTQYRWVALIQLADLFGTYGVSWLVMFGAACLFTAGRNASYWVSSGRQVQQQRDGHVQTPIWQPLLTTVGPLIAVIVVVAATVCYGQHRLIEGHQAVPGDTIRVALIQGSQDIRLEDSEEKNRRIHEHYLALAVQAARTYRDMDVMIWPETVYGGILVDRDDAPAIPPHWPEPELTPDGFKREIDLARARVEQSLVLLARHLNTRLLVGVETICYTRQGPRFYNSAAYVARCGEEAGPKSPASPVPLDPSAGTESAKELRPRYCYSGRYDKMHLVMFGEYIPFADRFPFLQKLSPLSTSTSPGKGPRSFRVKSLLLSPNICYESVIPHLIVRQVLELRKRGEEPDILVNLTNDGWFWGSSELDMHLVCGVFRAVETRKPFLIAANTGFSAVIGYDGKIAQQGPRRDVAILVADVGPSPLRSWYLDHGVIPNTILVACLGCVILTEITLSGALRRLVSLVLRQVLPVA